MMKIACFCLAFPAAAFAIAYPFAHGETARVTTAAVALVFACALAALLVGAAYERALARLLARRRV